MAVKELQWDLKFLWNCRFYFLCFGQVFFKVIATQKQHLLKFLMISELQRVDCFLNWSWWTSVLPLIEMISMLLLEHVTGIRGTASRWFRSYLQATFKFVRVPDMCSSYTRISHGVPQGTVFGSILFTLFMFPLGTIIWQHQINSPCHADDTQLYLSMKSEETEHAGWSWRCQVLDDLKFPSS